LGALLGRGGIMKGFNLIKITNRNILTIVGE
jgi:hypothetical protein